MDNLNGVMMQYFHWYIDKDLILWNEISNKAKEIKEAGITALWLPPAYKGMGGINDVGYAVYDMYDLGEFDQCKSVRTKYGDRKQYLKALDTLHQNGIDYYVDTVLNHKMGGDKVENVKATPFSQNDRINPIGNIREISAYSNYTFPKRNKKYSDFEWHWYHFDAVDYDDISHEKGVIFLLEGKSFDDYVALENGNFAYLMGCDLDFQNSEVREEVTRWGKWYLDTTNADGFRLDAIKHIAAWFFPEWIDEMEKYAGKDLFVVGEYWFNDVGTLDWYVDKLSNRMSVFDVPLHYNFHKASISGGNYDMSRILYGTVMKTRPLHAVTFVENHDSQPLQALESPVEAWFKPLAYAIILLRQEGYPCIFYGDYYGADYEDFGRDGNKYKITMPSHKNIIDKLLFARKNYAYGEQVDYFDHFNIVGWSRLGTIDHPKSMAVLLSDGKGGRKWMNVNKPNTKFIDLTGNINTTVIANNDGWGEFICNGGSVSVWIEDS